MTFRFILAIGQSACTPLAGSSCKCGCRPKEQCHGQNQFLFPRKAVCNESEGYSGWEVNHSEHCANQQVLFISTTFPVAPSLILLHILCSDGLQISVHLREHVGDQTQEQHI